MQTQLELKTYLVGYAALDANTTGAYNTAIGHEAGRFKHNCYCFYCYRVGCTYLSNTTGAQNTAVGYQACMQSNTEGGSTMLVWVDKLYKQIPLVITTQLSVILH